MKRIALFLLTNLAVMLVLSTTANLLGVNKWMTSQGINFGGLLVFFIVILPVLWGLQSLADLIRKRHGT